MLNQILLYLGALLPAFWGVAHLSATKGVVKGFGDISLDNRRIITMEWIVEGVALLFVGAVVASVTLVDHASTVSRTVYGVSFIGLNALSLVSLFTGSRVSFLPFKLCPLIFTTSSLLCWASMCSRLEQSEVSSYRECLLASLGEKRLGPRGMALW